MASTSGALDDDDGRERATVAPQGGAAAAAANVDGNVASDAHTPTASEHTSDDSAGSDDGAATPKAYADHVTGVHGGSATATDDDDSNNNANAKSGTDGSDDAGGERSTRARDTSRRGVLGGVPRKDVEFGDGDDNGDDDAVAAAELQKSDELRENMKQNSWVYTAVVMVASQCGIGMLGFPSVFANLGFVPATILTVFVAFCAWQSGIMIWRVKLSYPRMMNWHDAAHVILERRWARRAMIAVNAVQQLALMASFTLSVAIGLANVARGNGCLLLYNLAGAIAPWLLAQRRFFHNSQILLWSTFFTIIISVIVTLVSVITQAGGRVVDGVVASRAPGFFSATVSVLDIVFAFTGHSQYPAIIAEMRDPREFVYAITATELIAVIGYSLVGGLGYAYVGPDVASPVLTSIASYPLKVVAYMFLIVHVLGAEASYFMTLNHLVIPELFGLQTLFEWGARGLARYALVSGAQMVTCFVLVSLIPFFNEFNALTTSITGLLLSYLLPHVFWVGVQYRLLAAGKTLRAMWYRMAPRMRALAVWCGVIVSLYFYMMVTGVISSLREIVVGYTEGDGFTRPFSCDSSADTH